ncbi:MAG: four helix bundle protein [bacterium]|nr:four helix bundle protein [bacterium]
MTSSVFIKKFRFRNFQVYKDARMFCCEVKLIIYQDFPSNEKYCLSSQMWRALYSIILNIAEGSDRGTDKDFAHFLNLAHTSLNEVVACLDIALDSKYISLNTHNDFLLKAEALGNQLTAFRKKLLNNKL